MKYYAVREGFQPGIYTTYNDCLAQIKGCKGAKFKSFPTREEAELFMSGKDPSLDPNSASYTAKFYGVRSGKKPGVYTDWESAEQQVVGVQKPKVRCFSTRELAEAFVNSGGVAAAAAAVAAVGVGGRGRTPVERKRQLRGGDISVAMARQITEELSEVEERTPLAKKLKGVMGNDLNRMDDEDMRVDPPPYSELDMEFEPPAHRGIEGQDEESEDSDEDEDEDDDDDGESPTYETRAVASEIKPKPRIVAKKSSVLKIYTDGSSRGNGKASAIAGVGVWFGDHDTRNISEPLPGPRQTNQRAELTAILRAIGVAPMHRDVLIFTDSQYSIKCVTLWHIKWIKNNWMTSLGRPVENQDLVIQILDKLKEREEYGSKTSFEWVKGHTGFDDGNSQADKLANEGARMAQKALHRH